MDDHVLPGYLLPGISCVIDVRLQFGNLQLPTRIEHSRLVTFETLLSNFLPLPHVVAGSSKMLMKSAMSTYTDLFTADQCNSIREDWSQIVKDLPKHQIL
jgi:hypothetical protein